VALRTDGTLWLMERSLVDNGGVFGLPISDDYLTDGDYEVADDLLYFAVRAGAWRDADALRAYGLDSNPPLRIWDSPGTWYGVDVEDTVLVQSGPDRGVYSIANPRAPDGPRWLSTLPTSRQGFTLASGLVFGTGGNEVEIIDLSEPSDPRWLTQIEYEDRRTRALLVRDGLIFTSWDNDGGLPRHWVTVHALVPDPSHPRLLVDQEVEQRVYDFALRDSILARAQGFWEPSIALVGVGKRGEWRRLYEFPTFGDVLGIDFDGTTLIAAEFAGGLRRYDTSDPRRPVALGGVTIPGHASRAAAWGSRVYVADVDGGIRVLDGAWAETYRQVARYDDGRDYVRVAIDPHSSWVAATVSGLDADFLVFEDDGRGGLTEIGSWKGSGSGALAVADSVVFASDRNGVQAVDFADPSAPRLLAELPLPIKINTISAWTSPQGTLVMTGEGGLVHLYAFDWPSHPDSLFYELAVVPASGSVNDICRSSDLVAVHSILGELDLFRLHQKPRSFELISSGNLHTNYGASVALGEDRGNRRQRAVAPGVGDHRRHHDVWGGWRSSRICGGGGDGWEGSCADRQGRARWQPSLSFDLRALVAFKSDLRRIVPREFLRAV